MVGRSEATSPPAAGLVRLTRNSESSGSNPVGGVPAILNEKEAESFFREARAAAQLRHPNIVSVHEVGREADKIYIASDYILGASLREWLSGPLPPREAARLCAKIADALQAAHSAGVVHRDVKPGNIMMDLDQKVGLFSVRVWGLIVNLLANALALYGLTHYLRDGTHLAHLVAGLVVTGICILWLAKPSQ